MNALSAGIEETAGPRSLRWLAVVAYLVVLCGGANFLFVDAQGRAATNPVYTAMWAVVFALVALAFARDLLLDRSVPVGGRGFIFAVIPLLSAAWSIEPGVSAFYGGTFTVGALSGAMLASRMGCRALLAALLTAMKVIAIGSLVLLAVSPDRAIYHDFMERQSYLGLPAISGVMPHKNAAALAYGAGLALLATHGRAIGTRRMVLVGWAALFTVLGLASGSALFPLLAAFVAGHAFLGPAIRRRLLFPAFVTIVTMGALAGAGVDQLAPDWVYAALGRNRELTGRTEIWAITRELIAHRPWLGYGFEAAFRSEALYQSQLIHQFGYYRAPHAHNSYLQTALSVGIPGAVLMFALVGAAVRGAAALDLGARVQPALHGLVIVILAFCISGASENTLMQYNGAFAVLAGALIAYVRQEQALAAAFRPVTWRRFGSPATAPSPVSPSSLRGAQP